MTTREEAKMKLDALSDSSFEEIVKAIDEKVQIEKHLVALDAFIEGWTPEAAMAFEEGAQRRAWRSSESNE